jgi:GalNAc-alpha-(1->4)-GalNAc-alpha-(1->3)-diNAcBac-PP-undecaprenol alpha-1,4-N-acetyl-D-galactosaminyltransferase
MPLFNVNNQLRKILFVIHKINYGGAGKVLTFLANRFSLEGYEVYFLTYENNIFPNKLLPEVKHIGYINSTKPLFFFKRIFQIFFIRKTIININPDVIISFLSYPNILSIIASRGFRLPVIISERCDPYALKSWFTKFRNLVYYFADGCVFQTREAKNYYHKSIQEKAVVIPNPIIEAIPDKWIKEKDDIIVNVGRFELIQKRQDILIKAFAKIVDKFPNTNLVLFGDGEDEQKIKNIIIECHLEGRVVLAGVTIDIYESIKKAKLFVLSSDYEGIPNALIEAMSVGLPCVSTNYSPGGVKDIIKNMENGILVKAGCIDELARAIEYMLENPKLADMMGQNASKIVNKLNSEIIYRQWEKYIKERLSIKHLNK